MSLRAIFAISVALLMASVAALAAGKPAAEAPNDPVIAKVNGVEVHLSAARELAATLPPQARQQPQDKIYQYLLENLITNQLVLQAAHKAKFQDDPAVKRRLALVQDQIVAEAYVQRMAQKGVTDAKLHERYDKWVKESPGREEINARHILLANEADAKAVIDELKKGADFATLAKEKTTDPAGKASGGDLGYFTKEDMVAEFADAAFKLKKGEFTETPVKTQFGWHVIKVEDRRQAQPPGFEQKKGELANELGREIVQEKLKELKEAAKIEVFGPEGPKPAAPKPPPGPAPLPPGASVPGAPVLSPATAPTASDPPKQ